VIAALSASVAVSVSLVSPVSGDASGLNGALATPEPSGSRFTIGWPSIMMLGTIS